jgi:GNAT superfamily N-acetyltransferase
MHIRRALEGDIVAMHAIRLSVRENQLDEPRSVLPHHYQAFLAENGRGWVAEIDRRIVGFAVADRVHLSVWALFVDPDFEGQGIGRRLHQTMIEWLFDTGAEQIRLSTSPDTRAERFYRAAGWQPAGLDHGEACYVLSRETPTA